MKGYRRKLPNGYGDEPLRLIERVGNSWYIKKNFAYNFHGKSRFGEDKIHRLCSKRPEGRTNSELDSQNRPT